MPRIEKAHAVLQVRVARCCKVEDPFRIVEAHGVLPFLPSLDTCSLFLPRGGGDIPSAFQGGGG